MSSLVKCTHLSDNQLVLVNQQSRVRWNVIQIILGSHVIGSPKSRQEPCTVICQTQVRGNYMFNHFRKHIFNNQVVVLVQEDSSHSMQGLFGPRLEPIDAGIVHKSWEVSTPGSQGISDRWHREDNVQVVAALGHEVLPDHFLHWRDSVGLCFCATVANNSFFLVISKQRRNHTSCKHVVDQFEKS